MARIQAPVEGFSGEVVGVRFVDGVGESDGEAALAYFLRQGYTVGGKLDPASPPVQPPAGEPSSSDGVGGEPSTPTATPVPAKKAPAKKAPATRSARRG